MLWLTSTVKYAGGYVDAYDIELSTPVAVVYARTVGLSSPDIGAHLVDFELDYDTVYSWRVRAHVGNPDSVGPWSPWTIVPVADASGRGGAASRQRRRWTSGSGCSAPISPLGPGETRKPRPNHSATARAVAAQFPTAFAHSCQEHYGAAGWEYMDRTVDALRLVDGRYGYNAKRGNMNDPSLDVASYFYANGDNINNRPEVYIFDLIGGHCGATPSPVWIDVTDITFSSGTHRPHHVSASGPHRGNLLHAATAGQ